MSCLRQDKQDHMKRMDDVEKHWNSKKQLVDNFGKANTDIAKVQLNQLVFRHIENKIWDEDVPLTKNEIEHIKTKIDNLEGRMGSGINSVAKLTMFPDAIHGRIPSAMEFLNDMDRIENYNSHHREQSTTNYNSVVSALRIAMHGDALSNKIGAKIGIPDTFLAKLRSLEKQIAESGTDAEAQRYADQLEEMFKQTEGKTILQFIELMKMTNGEVEKIPGGVAGKYSKEIITAAKDARTHLDNLGGVLVNGLKALKGNTIWAITNQGDGKNALVQTNKKLMSFLESVDNAIERISKQKDPKHKDGGGYFPDVHLDHLVQLSQTIKKMDFSKGVGKDFYDNLFEAQQVMDVMLNKGAIQSHGRAKGYLKSVISRNPLFLLKQYENDVLYFNKTENMRLSYQKAIHKLGDSKVPAELVRTMKDYLEMQMNRAIIGTSNLNTWYNKSIRALTVIEATKSMGFGVLGATKNFLSGMFYVAGKGLWVVRRASILKDRADIRDVLAEVEKDQGFIFAKVTREAFTEGIQSEKAGADLSNYDYKMVGGELVLTHKGESVAWDTIDAVTQKALHAALLFHRMGENKLRRYIFQNTFALTYAELVDNKLYRDKINPDTKKPYGEPEMFRRAKNVATNAALFAVREYALQYSQYNKAPIISGTAAKEPGAMEYATRSGSLIFQFMQWPMGFLNMNVQAVKGTVDGFRSGHYINKESKNLAGMVGIYGLTSLISIAIGSDVTHLVENTTVEYARNLVDLWESSTDEEMPMREKMHAYGLLDQVTGPAVADIKHIAQVVNLWNTPDSVMANMFFGMKEYYKMNEEDQKAATAYRFGTQYGKWASKIGPDVLWGNGGFDTYLMHEYGIYPRSWTRQARRSVGLGKPRKFKDKTTVTADKTTNIPIRGPGGGGIRGGASTIRRNSGLANLTSLSNSLR